VAHALPASVDAALGKEGLAVMDRLFFSPSELNEPRQRELHAIFSDIAEASTDDHEFKLIFRKSPRIGANAFALPSGIVVVTDELVTLARNDNEIIAVLAHEIGHVVHRHALRRLLQDSTVVLVIAAVTGDIASITSLAATIPVVLVEAKYSRDFEREADDYSLQYLRTNDISPRHFADILQRMEQSAPGGRLGATGVSHANAHRLLTNGARRGHERADRIGSGIGAYGRAVPMVYLGAPKPEPDGPRHEQKATRGWSWTTARRSVRDLSRRSVAPECRLRRRQAAGASRLRGRRPAGPDMLRSTGL
jgi:Zn-dependent protease with chaperone function